ncbi:Aste57867_20529 [Aphanomyces stellatus]|uniref:Aste57867_20529 protein n=1 Tax=Aphanomyces stellatus TaxID=120398 RepID=A0A485LF49_9STRA|nr:hypothetical protein As57867_020462 [Aphanomyces stellatus]VFT97214.1 Aste57867_20529 [Aphanomyces stellatus]
MRTPSSDPSNGVRAIKLAGLPALGKGKQKAPPALGGDKMKAAAKRPKRSKSPVARRAIKKRASMSYLMARQLRIENAKKLIRKQEVKARYKRTHGRSPSRSPSPEPAAPTIPQATAHWHPVEGF